MPYLSYNSSRGNFPLQHPQVKRFAKAKFFKCKPGFSIKQVGPQFSTQDTPISSGKNFRKNQKKKAERKAAHAARNLQRQADRAGKKPGTDPRQQAQTPRIAKMHKKTGAAQGGSLLFATVLLAVGSAVASFAPVGAVAEHSGNSTRTAVDPVLSLRPAISSRHRPFMQADNEHGQASSSSQQASSKSHNPEFSEQKISAFSKNGQKFYSQPGGSHRENHAPITETMETIKEALEEEVEEMFDALFPAKKQSDSEIICSENADFLFQNAHQLEKISLPETREKIIRNYFSCMNFSSEINIQNFYQTKQLQGKILASEIKYLNAPENALANLEKFALLIKTEQQGVDFFPIIPRPNFAQSAVYQEYREMVDNWIIAQILPSAKNVSAFIHDIMQRLLDAEKTGSHPLTQHYFRRKVFGVLKETYPDLNKEEFAQIKAEVFAILTRKMPTLGRHLGDQFLYLDHFMFGYMHIALSQLQQYPQASALLPSLLTKDIVLLATYQFEKFFAENPTAFVEAYRLPMLFFAMKHANFSRQDLACLWAPVTEENFQNVVRIYQEVFQKMQKQAHTEASLAENMRVLEKELAQWKPLDQLIKEKRQAFIAEGANIMVFEDHKIEFYREAVLLPNNKQFITPMRFFIKEIEKKFHETNAYLGEVFKKIITSFLRDNSDISMQLQRLDQGRDQETDSIFLQKAKFFPVKEYEIRMMEKIAPIRSGQFGTASWSLPLKKSVQNKVHIVKAVSGRYARFYTVAPTAGNFYALVRIGSGRIN